MIFKFTLFVCLSFAACINAGSIGLVGLGRNLFQPLCCYTCLSSFWGLQLPCTIINRNPSQETGSGPSCHSTNTAYLSSLAYCMQTRCAAENVSSRDTEQCWAEVAGDGLPVGSLQMNLPSTVPNITLSYDATVLDQPSLVDDQYYDDSRTTIQGYVKQEFAHALYGTILVAVVVGFCFCLGLHRLIHYALPGLSLPRPMSSFLSKYFYLPALVGSMHLRKFPGNIGYVPSRALTLLIICYITLNAVLCAINYPALNRDTWYVTTKKQHTSWVADRLGVLCFANIAVTIMFSGRNTPLLWITGCNRTDIITFHRWIARITAIEAVVHVALYWGGTNRNGYRMFTLAAGMHTVNYNQSYWTFGIVAVIAIAAMATILSMLPLRTRLYEIFLFLHIIVAAILLVGIWYHVVYRYNKAYGYEVWLYIAFAFWGFDRIARPLRVVVLNWKSWVLPSHPSAIVEPLPGDEFMKVTVFPSLTWNFSAGQYCYLYFPSLRTNPFQSHPFTIASWDYGSTPPQQLTTDDTSSSPEYPTTTLPRHSTQNSTEPIIELQDISLNTTSPASTPPLPSKSRISFIIRPESGITKHLHARFLNSSKASKISVMVEGPYGSAPKTKFRNANTILAIAGGIGITSILGYLQLYLAELKKGSKRRPSRFILFWTAREESLISAMRSQIGDVEVLKTRGVEIRIVYTGTREGERVDVQELVRREVMNEGSNGRSVSVVCCGPGALADGVRRSVVDVVGQKGVSVDLIEEAFCW